MNNLIILHKNLDPKERLSILFVRFLLDGIAGIKSLLQGRFVEFKSILKAHFAYYKWLSKKKSSVDFPSPPLEHLAGVYKKSLVWQYFICKKKTFAKVSSSNN